MSCIKYISVSIIAIFLCPRANCQNKPVYDVPSPEVSSLGTYGQVPVSPFTGIADISIPIHTVKAGNFSLPITASYHTANVKPNKTQGPLGLGWTLMAGGYIARTVRGYYDEKMDSQGVAHGFYGHASKMKNVTQSSFSEMTRDHFVSGDDYYELCADEFSFSFCGYSGNFYYNENNGWTVVSDYDIKVEFNPANGFVSFNQLKGRLHYNGWNWSAFNQRYFNKFTLTTPDGTKWEFGGDNAVEFSISYYNRDNSDLIATAWRLTKITTPEKRVVNIEYDASLQTCELHYQPLYRFSYYPGADNSIQYKTGRRGYTGFLLFPVNISKITSPNEIVEFTYNRDWSYGRRLMPSGIDALYWSESGYSRDDIYMGHNDPSNQFFLFSKASSSGGEVDRRRSIADSLTNYYMHRIAIRNRHGGNSKSFYFNYNLDNRRKISEIIELGRIPNLQRDTFIVSHGIGIVTDYQMPSLSSDEERHVYQFVYNNPTNNRLPSDYIIADTDSWGYYNGGTINISSANIPMEISLPMHGPTKAEILTDVIYPTGGRAHFEYEQNKYAYRIDSALCLKKVQGYAGGLRISEISIYNEKQNIVKTKKFYYSKTKTSSGCSGILKATPVFELTQTLEGTDYYIYQRNSGGYYAPVTNLNSPDVGYSWVIEETLDSLRNSSGYIRYHYSNYDMGADGKRHLDELPLYGLTANYALSPYSSLSFERGKLLTKEVFSSSGKRLQVEAYTYARTEHAVLQSANQNTIYFGPLSPNAVNGWITNTYTASYLPVSRTDTIYSQTDNSYSVKHLVYSYNNHKMLRQKTEHLSNGSLCQTTYKYPFELSGYTWMTNAHITSPVVEEAVSSDGLMRKNTYTFQKTDLGVPYVSKTTRSYTSAYGRELFEVGKTDKYGNPVEITEDGKKSVLLWSCYGQLLTARIENLTFAQCKYLLGIDPLNFSNQGCSPDINSLMAARKKMPQALFHIYQYNGDMLMESETEPNGMTKHYKYDVFGRLREIYVYENSVKRVLKRYDYRYYNQTQQ